MAGAMRYTALEREVEIRPMTADDSTVEIDRLFHTSHALLADHALRRYYPDEMFGKGSVENPRGELFVAQSETRLIGGLVFFDPENTKGCPFYDRPDVASIGPFAIMPEFQGHGLGGAMLQVVQQRAREAGAVELGLDIAPEAIQSMNKFIKDGFRYVENARWEGSTRRCVILSYRLSP
jgi:GNAT superfamily N-acetyltransferase